MAYSVWLPKNDLLQRIFTTVFAIPAVVYLVLQKPIFFQIVTVIFAFGVFREWSRLVLNYTYHLMNYVCLALLLLMFIPKLQTLSVLAIFASCLVFYYLQKNNHNRLIAASGYLYLTTSLAILLHIFPLVDEPHFVLVVLAMIWLVDIGAFIVGKSLGGPKLAPIISPNKTWSGFIGGIIISGIGTWLLCNALDMKILNGFWLFVLMALPLAQGGDLLESWCKRRFKVKDSGNFFPGHGGLLDRLDSILAVSFAVAVWWYLCK
jgi:phosphatidate cytidylyltransferase